MIFLYFSSRIRLNFRYLYEVFAFKSFSSFSETDFSDCLCAKTTKNVSLSHGDQPLVCPLESCRYLPRMLLKKFITTPSYWSGKKLVYECNNKLLRKCKINPLGAKKLVYECNNKLLRKREIIPLVGAITDQNETKSQNKTMAEISRESLHCQSRTELKSNTMKI